MPFPRWLFWSLLGPLLLLLLPYAYSLGVMWRNPESSLESRGAGVLLAAALATCIAEVIAVPAALYVLLRNPPYRTAGNLVVTAIGTLPIGICAFLFAVLMYGHR